MSFSILPKHIFKILVLSEKKIVAMQKLFLFWDYSFVVFGKDNCFAQTGSSTTVKLTDKNSFLAHYKTCN